MGKAAAFRIPGACPTIRAPGRSPRPESRQLGHLERRCSLPDPRHPWHGQSNREDLRHPGAGGSAALGEAAAFRILTGPTVRAPGGSPRPRSGQLGRPGQHCSLPDPRRRLHGQSTRQISEARERAARPPWVKLQPSGSSPAPRSEHREDLRDPGAGNRPPWTMPPARRILGACSTVRAPGRSPRPRSGQLAGPGCAAAFRIPAAGRTVRDAREASGSSAPAARSAHPAGSPKPRNRQLAFLDAL